MIRPGSGNYPNNINPMQLNQATLNQLAQMQNPMFRNRMPISMNNNGTTTATPVASAPTQPEVNQQNKLSNGLLKGRKDRRKRGLAKLDKRNLHTTLQMQVLLPFYPIKPRPQHLPHKLILIHHTQCNSLHLMVTLQHQDKTQCEFLIINS
ncbi:hypothetical protein K502DRAFT_79277 [Neoconidiobolus thromboides FSU 785]|nr:hypothetical protein K502DRAFT_79277 [Neoconidiobolus thromboides FSU 785]